MASGADVERRVNAGNKVNGGIHAVVTNKSMSKKARMARSFLKLPRLPGPRYHV